MKTMGVPYYTLSRNYKVCINITKNRLLPLYARKPDFSHFDGKLLETYSTCLCVLKPRLVYLIYAFKDLWSYSVSQPLTMTPTPNEADTVFSPPLTPNPDPKLPRAPRDCGFSTFPCTPGSAIGGGSKSPGNKRLKPSPSETAVLEEWPKVLEESPDKRALCCIVQRKIPSQDFFFFYFALHTPHNAWNEDTHSKWPAFQLLKIFTVKVKLGAAWQVSVLNDVTVLHPLRALAYL